MQQSKLIYSLVLCLCLTSCGQAGADLRTVYLNDASGAQKAVFRVELALDAQAWEQGLMRRTSLPAAQGMLFLFPQTAPRSFWMKSTLIPLDIIFFDSNGRLINFETAEPCRQEPCPIYNSEAPSQSVLEINAGLAKQQELETGDQLILE